MGIKYKSTKNHSIRRRWCHAWRSLRVGVGYDKDDIIHEVIKMGGLEWKAYQMLMSRDRPDPISFTPEQQLEQERLIDEIIG